MTIPVPLKEPHTSLALIFSMPHSKLTCLVCSRSSGSGTPPGTLIGITGSFSTLETPGISLIALTRKGLALGMITLLLIQKDSNWTPWMLKKLWRAPWAAFVKVCWSSVRAFRLSSWLLKVILLIWEKTELKLSVKDTITLSVPPPPPPRKRERLGSITAVPETAASKLSPSKHVLKISIPIFRKSVGNCEHESRKGRPLEDRLVKDISQLFK